VIRAARAVLACAVAASPGGAFAKAAEPSGPYRFECSIALLMPDGRFTDSASVTVSFVADRATLRDIHVVDPGGILFPGGNFKFVHKPDVISMEAVEMPAERPGQWSGAVEKKMYRLTLASPPLAQAVTIGLGRTPAKTTGRYGLVWNASHQPEGSPRPISGSGGGNCALGGPQESPR
jgi:hypothetical protein